MKTIFHVEKKKKKKINIKKKIIKPKNFFIK